MGFSVLCCVARKVSWCLKADSAHRWGNNTTWSSKASDQEYKQSIDFLVVGTKSGTKMNLIVDYWYQTTVTDKPIATSVLVMCDYSAFWIAQVAFKFECDRLNGNSATVCHWISIHQIHQIWKSWSNRRMAIQAQKVTKLVFGHLTDFSQIWQMVIWWQTVTELPFGRAHSNSNANGIHVIMWAN